MRTCTRRKSRAATLSELASRSTAPATLPPPRSSAATCSSTRGERGDESALVPGACEVQRERSADGSREECDHEQARGNHRGDEGQHAQADRPELDGRFRRDADIGIRQGPLEPAAHPSRKPPARSARERASARARIGVPRSRASSRRRAAKPSAAIATRVMDTPPAATRAPRGGAAHARGPRLRSTRFAHAGTRGGPVRRRQRPRRPRRSPRSHGCRRPDAPRTRRRRHTPRPARARQTGGGPQSASSTSVSSRRERVGRAVGVHGGHRSVVPGVERLEHVERLATAHLSDDEAIGPHPERGAHELAHRDPAGALGVRGSCLEPHHVWLREPELGGLLDRHDALVFGNRRRERVEQRGLAGARGSRHEEVPARERPPTGGTGTRPVRPRTPRAAPRACRIAGW